LWGKVAKPVNKAEWAGYALVYITAVNGIRTGRDNQPGVQHRLHIHIGVSGTDKRDRDLKHAYVCGIGPSAQAMRVGAKVLCAAFRAEEQPTETLGFWRSGMKKLLREALARATATLPPPPIVVVAPVFNAPTTILASAASPASTLAPPASPASTLAPADSPASTLEPAAQPASTPAPADSPVSTLAPADYTLASPTSTLAPAASQVSTLAPADSPVSTLAPADYTLASPTSTLAPAASPAFTLAPPASPASTLAPAAPPASTLALPASTLAPAAPPTSTLAPVASSVYTIAPTDSASVAAPILAASSTTIAPASYLVTSAGAGQSAADPTDAQGEDMSDVGGWASEDPDLGLTPLNSSVYAIAPTDSASVRVNPSVLATATLGTFDFGFGGDDHAESGAGNLLQEARGGAFIPPTFQSGRGRKRLRTTSHLSAPAAGRTGFGYVLAFTRYFFAQRFVCTNQ